MIWRKVRIKLTSRWEEPLRRQRNVEHVLRENGDHLRSEWTTIKRFGLKAAAQKKSRQKFDVYLDDYTSILDTRVTRTARGRSWSAVRRLLPR